MKNLLSISFLLMAINICCCQTTLEDINWPLKATIPSCNDLPNEVPFVPSAVPENRFHYTSSNLYIPDTSTSCYKLIVTWFALDLVENKTIDSFIIYNVD